MMIERHSHKKLWLAIVILAIVAITFLVATAWVLLELNRTQNTLLRVESELETARTQLADTEAELATVEIELNTSRELIESLGATLSNLQVNYARLTTGYGYVLRDPSYQEMRDFLARDRTNERTWVRRQYTCVDFADDVKANAAKEGIRSAFVIIEHPEAGHAIVAFYTTDRGLVFIEPQLDWKVEPRIGQRYYQSVRPPPGHYAPPRPGHDDTITRIIVIW
jgi:uncharacterized membrane-anchored protein YhcB (DUF1043 family)